MTSTCFPSLIVLKNKFHMEFFGPHLYKKKIQNFNIFTAHDTQEDAVPFPTSNTPVTKIGLNAMKSTIVNYTAYSTKM